MSEPTDHYLPDPNILERKVAEYLARSNEGGGDEWRGRSVAEAAEMQRLIRWSVVWAAVAGIVSGSIIGGVETWMHLGVLDGDSDAGDAGWREQLPIWAGFFAFAGVISAVEILFLYVLTIRGAAKLSNRSGIALGHDGYPALFGLGLARAALDLPNPRVLVYGVDPYAYMPGWWIAVRNIAYKMKVGVSSFLLRIFLRRVMGRMAIRGLIPLIAGPLYALWNAIIVWRIMNEERLRTLGPFAVEDLLRQVSGEEERPGPEAVEVMMHGVGEMLMRGHDAHPNQVLLLSRLRRNFNYESEAIDVDWERQRTALRSLESGEQEAALNLLTLSSVLGRRTYKEQKKFLLEAHDDCGLTLKPERLKHLRKRLKEGRTITPDDYASVR
ncbi:MAG: hypothetical protein EA421_04975 [Gemmatimonadales bacterium]|nr:MAG: hypothetical protein EA421_04975 [Gemmatimonadales bacterium]